MSAKLRFLVILCAAAVLVVVVLVANRGPSVDKTTEPSTFSAHPLGCKALFLVLEELGLPVDRLRKPLTRLDAENGILVIIDPRKQRMSGREMTKLAEWVKNGNTLLLFQGHRGKVLSDKDSPDFLPTPSLFGQGRLNDAALHFGLKVKTFPDKTRKSVSATISGILDVHHISVSGKARWKETPDGWTNLAGDDKGPVVLERKLGLGRVFAVSDPTLPSNAQLEKENNLRLILALMLKDTAPSKILFDEYHHGYIIADTFSEYVAESVFYWILVQMIIAGVLFFYSRRAVHAGRFRSLAPPAGRSSLEHVESMAGIFRSCKASSVALEAVMRRFLANLSRKTGVRLRGLNDESLDDLRVNLPGVSENIGVFLRECREAVNAADNPDRALALARKAGELTARINSARRFG